MREHRVLVVMDNFESVCSMPDATTATPALDEGDRAELVEFLHGVAGGGRGMVVLTSRSPEPWLGVWVRRVGVGGLSTEEAAEYADQLLTPYPHIAAVRGRRVFGKLMEWLDGHPLSMRLILPLLDTTAPEALLAGLRGTTPLTTPTPDDADRTAGGDRGTSLPACVTYSITHLDQRAQRLLVAVCLFHGVADADVLAAFSQTEEVPARFAGVDTYGWAEVLNAAAGVGLLTPLGPGMYGIHPALPGYMAGSWQADNPNTYDVQRVAAEAAFLTANAGFAIWLHSQIGSGHAGLAFALIERHRRTLSHLLGVALDTAVWDQANAIARPLDDYWNARGLAAEARGWVDRARLLLEAPDGAPPPFGQPAGGLWLFLVGAEGQPSAPSGTPSRGRHHLRQHPRRAARPAALAQTRPRPRNHLPPTRHGCPGSGVVG